MGEKVPEKQSWARLIDAVGVKTIFISAVAFVTIVASVSAIALVLSFSPDRTEASNPTATQMPAAPTATPTQSAGAVLPAPAPAPAPAPDSNTSDQDVTFDEPAPAGPQGPTPQEIAAVQAQRQSLTLEIADARARIDVYNAELAQQEYFMSVAIAYGDTLAEQRCRALINQERAKIERENANIGSLTSLLNSLPNY
jgi:hypothetical protein